VDVVDFDISGKGDVIPGGSYVSDEWYVPFGMNITALATCGGFTPNGKARIFNTSDPDNLVIDPDLGSPNR
jgi:hypothetical protein